MSITNKVSNKSVMPGITPVPDVVDAPTIGTATAGTESATVAFTAAATGGAATSFTAISTPGSITGTGSSPITVSGLTAGTSYTFKVYGTNSSGTWSAVQSAASNSVTPTVPTSYESIATVTVGSGGAASIEFTSIPGTYAHLQLRGIARSDRAQTQDFWEIRFNSDTSSNYSNTLLYGDGSNKYTSAEANATYAAVFYSSAANTTASVFSGSVFDILDYANTNKYKTLRGLSGMDYNGTGRIQSWSGNWRNTNAITSIKLTSNNSANFAQYSSFALYGIKAAA